jgi:signal transduction histidine kinase
MNLSLRARYFRSLMVLLTASCAAFLLLFSVYEWREHGGLSRDGIDEVLYLLGLMLLMTPFVLWAAWQIAGQLLHPLRAVLGTAERIRAGNLNERIPVGGPRDELVRTGEALNHAFDRYADAVARLERFSADASHQLRTPLAAVRAAGEVCLQQERSPEAYRETIGEMLEEVDHMQHTVEQLLQLARLDPALLRGTEALDLRAALREWAMDMAAAAADRGIRIDPPPEGPPLPMRAHPRLLREVFVNLLNNALAATPDGGVIRCGVARTPDGRIAWTVEDSGPGIPPEDRARVRDRFYRGARAQGRGAGLGLSIVEHIVDLHGGLLEIETSEALGGACLRMTFPP